MSSDNQETPTSSGQRVFWRSLEHKADPTLTDAAACGSDVVKRNVSSEELFSINRRKFLTLSGAIGTLAGIEGCIRRPAENILPYSDMPEFVNPGVPNHYATVTTTDGDPLGLVVTSYEGRPTKVEGNPDHPVSQGATDLWAQSSILDLYDTERSRQPFKDGAVSSFEEFDKLFAEQISAHQQRAGAGLFILAQSSASPSYVRVRELVLKRLPRATFVTYAPISQANSRLGAAIAFGQPLVPLHSFEKAKVVLALDSDFLGSDPGSVSASRGFAKGREVETAAAAEMNRLYVVEPNLSVTGGSADHRLRLAGGDIGRYTRALAAELAAGGVSLSQVSAAVRGGSSEGIPAQWIKAVAKELLANRGRSLIVAGYRQPPAVHALVAALNQGLGNVGQTVDFIAPLDTSETDPFAAITFLAREMEEGNVKTLITFGGNPIYDAPPETRFADNYKKIPFRAHFSSYVDETGALATWQIPRAHELESWGDAQTASGYYSVQQPLIAPLWGGRSDIEVLAQIAGVANWRGYDVVQATLQERGIRGELAWRELLHKGVANQRFAAPTLGLAVKDVEIAAALKQFPDPPPVPQDSFEAVFIPDPKVFDGRHANNVWLQELPDPMTRIVWDNAALFAPSTAKQLGIENGDMVRITRGDDKATIDIVAWRQPGVAARSVILPLGWGRTRAGRSGNKKGFDVYPLRSLDSPHFAAVKIEKLGHKYPVSVTQEHDLMEGRPIALDATLSEYKARPNFVEFSSPDPHYGPLWKPQDYSQGNQWGMVIDLNTCSGCSACVIACQSENNVPVVGKDQVARGREMAWLRIDRYYVGDEDEPEVAFQGVACQHCETAPCENVCPVAATAHSPEGLNDIAYNRCIGTRYCMNNCPYKVRRFNFLNFNEDIPETTRMQKNPNVTVRFRGVIEKCSYCVQRIQLAKSKAKQQGRHTLREGDVTVACQQACSTGSITFGDINDPNSAVSKKRASERNYALLAEVGTKPRTRYLGKIRNPNPEMKG